MNTQRFEYTIDRHDVITHVNRDWKSFAQENDGGELGEGVVGTWLWQHFSGMEVKHLFRVLLEKVRETRRTVRVPFRCDAPELRRDMMLEVEPLSDGSVRFASWIVQERERPRVRLLEATREVDPGRFLRMCAWCKRIGLEGNAWMELEDALALGGLFTREPLPKITHGVCEDCQALVLRELQDAV